MALKTRQNLQEQVQHQLTGTKLPSFVLRYILTILKGNTEAMEEEVLDFLGSSVFGSGL